MPTDSEHEHNMSFPIEASETSSSADLLSEIRETLAQEGQGTTKPGRGLFAWLRGLFKQEEPAVSEEPSLPVAPIPQVKPGPEEDEELEMMGAFPVYRPKELSYFELEETSETENEDIFEMTGSVFPEETAGTEDITAFGFQTIQESELAKPIELEAQTGDEDSGEWKNLLTKLRKKQDKENTPDLDDASLEERLQRSMGDDSSEGMEAWLASLREQEKSANAAIEPDWPEDEAYPGPQTSLELRSDELSSAQSQINDPFADRTKDLRLPPHHYTTRLNPVEENQVAYAEGEEVETTQPVSTPLHAEIFTPGEGEKDGAGIDLREIALEDYEAPPSTGEVINPEEPETALKRFAARISDRSRSQQVLIYAVILIIFMGIVLSVMLALRALLPALASAPAAPAAMVNTSAPGSAPYPLRLILTGGWPFDLNRGVLQNGQWEPQGSEWLEGTELRRVVGLRYNAQLEAVVNSLKKGDEISVVMSNADTILYKVDEIKTVPVEDTGIFMGMRPSLLIVLFDQKANERRVILCGQ